MKGKREKHYSGFNKSREFSKQFARTQSKLNLIAPKLESKGIKIEKLEKGEIIHFTYGDKLGVYYATTGIHNFLDSPVKRKPSLNVLEQRVTENSFDEFIEAFVESAGIPPDTEKVYDDEEAIDKKIEIIKPLILSVDEELKKIISRNPNFLYSISSRKFEELIASILRDFGFYVELTKTTRDGGKDILAYIKNEVTSLLTFVECKHYSQGNPVGVNAVRNILGVQEIYQANKSLIITSSYFTKDAIRERNLVSSKLDLKDNKDIFQWLNNYK